MVLNYALGRSLTQAKEHRGVSKKSLLVAGIVGNVGLLGYFKYADFFIGNVNLALGSSFGLLELALPLAISFFTFQQIAYLVDSYRGETYEYDFLNYAVFVSFFPQLIAGPIVHHKEMMPQFANVKNKLINYKNIGLGLFLFSLGLFKKVALADSFAVWATEGFDVAERLSFFEAWATSLSYTFQLYFDFSGYTDMALGIALLFNIRLPINFDSPYKARNIQDFWRRWHITLSRFLKEYVYIPLGGNKKGSFRTYSNLMATFIIGGLWHGAGWTFVFWGFLHGVALVVHRAWSRLGLQMPLVLAWFLTFNFINLSWVFFRAREWDDAIKVLSAMFDLSGIVVSKKFASMVEYVNPLSEYMGKYVGSDTTFFINIATFEMLVFGFFVVLVLDNSNSYLRAFSFKYKYAFFVALSLMVFHFMQIGAGESIFLYFNF